LCVGAPYSWCIFVGVSRLADNWHHPSDVLAGLILGWTSATVAYHLWFPPVWVSPWPWSDWGDRKENL
jgi:membrane-associated phospholipid phosphatase